MKSTAVDLVNELLARPASAARDAIIRRAQALEFHDYKSSLELPKAALVEALAGAGFGDLAQRAMAGEWDEQPDAADRAELEAHFGAATMAAVRRARSPEEVLAIARGANRDARRRARRGRN